MRGTGDCVYRADAIEALYKDAEAYPDHTFWTTQHEALRNIPAADVRPVVRARWNTVKYPLYKCSNCGAVYQDVGYGFNYCPNCGAELI